MVKHWIITIRKTDNGRMLTRWPIVGWHDGELLVDVDGDVMRLDEAPKPRPDEVWQITKQELTLLEQERRENWT